MSLGSNKELAQNKLILLYIIDKINIPLSNMQITRIILEKKYMNYFFLQQFLSELCDGGLLSSSIVENKTIYNITESGKQTLTFFLNMVPYGIRSSLDNSLSSIRRNLKNEILITADFLPESENEFVVTCKVHEDNFSLIDLKITVGTKNDAREICENWKRSPQAIYTEIIESLIKKRE
jgi:DNA-binding PadR family transcriptional regulator